MRRDNSGDLTGQRAPPTIKVVHSFLRRRVRPVAAVLIVALATVASLSCLTASGLVDRPCGPMMARDHGCCSTDAGDDAFRQVAGPKAFSLDHPILKLVATLVFVAPQASSSTAPMSLVRESRGSPPGSRDVPLYLSLSTIRV